MRGTCFGVFAFGFAFASRIVSLLFHANERWPVMMLIFCSDLSMRLVCSIESTGGVVLRCLRSCLRLRLRLGLGLRLDAGPRSDVKT